MASARHLFALAVVSCAAVSTAGVLVLTARDDGGTIRLPGHRPAADAAGARGWSWPDGTPGWEAGERIHGYPVSGVQPVELDAARLAAARSGLDSERVRVLTSVRGNRQGPLAILAAPTTEETPTHTCLAGLLQGDEPVEWRCGEGLADRRVLVAAARYTWTYRTQPTRHPLYLVGVARGDVRRVTLVAGKTRQPLYTRGSTWGEFEAAIDVGPGARLLIYDRRGLAQTLPLDLAPGTQRVF